MAELERKPGEAGERVAKVMARAGLCSRRDAERWIAEGRVSLDGKKLTSPAVLVTPVSDLRVDGKVVPQPERARLWRYHKPAGLVTTHRDEKGRPTVFEKLPAELPRVVSVGRLDLTSEGLLLLTNDGALAREMELPSRGWLRRYRVRVHGTVDPAQLKALENGITLEKIHYGPIRAELERVQGANAWIAVSLTEGKNREIRRVMTHLGLAVSRLIRIAYGPFQLGSLPKGAAEEVPRRVIEEQLTGSAKPPRLKGASDEVKRPHSRHSRSGTNDAGERSPPRSKQSVKPKKPHADRRR